MILQFFTAKSEYEMHPLEMVIYDYKNYNRVLELKELFTTSFSICPLKFYLQTLSQNSNNVQMNSENIAMSWTIFFGHVHRSLGVRVLKFSSVIEIWAQMHLFRLSKEWLAEWPFYPFLTVMTLSGDEVLHTIKTTMHSVVVFPSLSIFPFVYVRLRRLRW